MKKKFELRGVFVFLACLVALSSAFALPALALEIPVSATSSDDGKALRIAYADMELIYNVCPQKARATKEYRDAKDAYETEIASITAAIAVRRGETERLQKEIEEFRRGTSGGPVAVSTGSQPSTGQLPAPVSSEASAAETVEAVYQKELSRKAADTQISELESALEKSRQEMTSELSEIEKNCSMDILQTIYKALEQIAAEEELLVIIDKNYILYAPEAYDITSKVIDRLK